MKLIVGLGNPGSSYTNTRHNLGAAWVKLLCQKYNINLQNNSKINALIANLNQEALCMIPNSYMNHSGFSVQSCFHYYKIAVTNLIVVHDDLDLNPGEIKLKLSGGHGGHNGLRHIIEQLNSNDFVRLRIGIGRPGQEVKNQVTDYVLGRPNGEELLAINTAMNRGLDIVNDLLAANWPKVMQFLHTPTTSGEL